MGDQIKDRVGQGHEEEEDKGEGRTSTGDPEGRRGERGM